MSKTARTNNAMSKREYEILKAYENGNYIVNEEVEKVLLDYASTGDVSFGFLSNTAKLTEMGKKTLRNAERLGFEDNQ